MRLGIRRPGNFPGLYYFLGNRATRNTGVPLVIAFIGWKLNIKDLTLRSQIAAKMK
jgi:hypothetical protein